MRWIRQAPVTAELLIICAVVFALCSLQSIADHERFEVVQRSWGAVQSREAVEFHDGVRKSYGSELRGPFDVWNGEWWRIPLTAFHHENLLHLAFNLSTGWYLGMRLERFWGRFRMLLFIVPASFIPMLAEVSLGHAVVGFSGVTCAMLGALSVLRRYDERLASRFPALSSDIGMGAILLFWLLTLLGIDKFANLAHLSGFVYGGIVAMLSRHTPGPLILKRLGLIVVHLAIVPAFFEAIRPSWNGEYFWYRAITVSNLDLRETYLEKAIRRQPILTGAWLDWSQMAETRGDSVVAWKRLIQGLSLNPSNAPLIDGARRLWRHLELGQRGEAEMILVRYFGKRASLWMNQIRAEVLPEPVESNEKLIKTDAMIDPREFSLNQKLELPAIDVFSIQPNQLDPAVPAGGNDAVEGETL